MEYPTPQENW